MHYMCRYESNVSTRERRKEKIENEIYDGMDWYAKMNAI